MHSTHWKHWFDLCLWENTVRTTLRCDSVSKHRLVSASLPVLVVISAPTVRTLIYGFSSEFLSLQPNFPDNTILLRKTMNQGRCTSVEAARPSRRGGATRRTRTVSSDSKRPLRFQPRGPKIPAYHGQWPGGLDSNNNHPNRTSLRFQLRRGLTRALSQRRGGSAIRCSCMSGWERALSLIMSRWFKYRWAPVN